MKQTYEHNGTQKPRGFRSKEYGPFKCVIKESVLTFDGSKNLLEFKGKKENETLVVPDFLLPEAKQIMRKGTGDKMLDFARLCIVHEVALSAHQPHNS